LNFDVSALNIAKMSISRLRALTFDVTNTLIKARQSIGHQYAAAAQVHGIEANPAALETVFEATMQQKKVEMPDYGKHHGVSSKDWWADVVRRVFINSGHHAPKAALAKVSDTLWDHFQEEPAEAWEVMTNVVEGLEALKANGYRLGIVSNFDETLGRTLRASGLDVYFDFQVSSEQLGISKPKPGIFEKALGEFSGGRRLMPGEVAHVGDEIKNDYVAPRNIGITAFLVDNEGLMSNAVMQRIVDRRHIVRDIKGLSNLLATSQE
jgi:REG-2-like HAD superfamily hydrolase